MSKKTDIYKESLHYHSKGRPGKLAITPTKSFKTQRDLSLAYSPGVAQPCMEIYKNPQDSVKYTARGNLVAVISNGTAVLGLGNLGATACKPVMEGKAILFKRFADIDVFDIEINTEDPQEFIQCVKLLEPTFGGINLEDIKAPECFHIEAALKKEMNIPVFHDDQHGTAIISGAALLNALDLVEKDIDKVRVVFSGGGAAAIACARLYKSMGVLEKNIILCDSRGVVYKKRKEGMNEFKKEFATSETVRTLGEAMEGADVFCGLSVKGAVTPDMVKAMAKNPIVFAMANPDPEISYPDAKAARKDVIMATGRSDYPNQVNNVLGFPFIFRGALDVQATAINEAMKLAAVKALAKLAKEDGSAEVSKAYDGKHFQFGPDYIIPKPFDSRALTWVSPAIARAAMESGVAQNKIDLDEYVATLTKRLGVRQSFVRSLKDKVQVVEKNKKSELPSIVFPEGVNQKILRACEILVQEEIARPILLGNTKRINTAINNLGLTSLRDKAEIISTNTSPLRQDYAKEFYELRKRKGMSQDEAYTRMKTEGYYAAMMVRRGDADGLLSGITQSYNQTIRPILQTVGSRKGMKISGVYMMLFRERILFLADTTINIEPTSHDLADIAIGTAEAAQFLGIEPKIAMLSFSNFGSNNHPLAKKVREATQMVKLRRPDLVVDGEMQADTAVCPEIVRDVFPFCDVKDGANVLVFPDLQSANVTYKLLQRLGGAEAIGPILVGMDKPVNVLQRAADVDEIINMAMFTVLEIDAQNNPKEIPEKTARLSKRTLV